MGQGLFGAIGFGATLTKAQYDALCDGDGNWKPSVERPRTAYESKNEYAAYLIFDNGGYTDQGHDQRYAVSLGKLESDTRQRYPETYKKAKKDWAALRRAAKKVGMELPAGELIYVHDYD